MKRANYNGEFDEFEVPSAVWNNIEQALNEEDRKKRGFIWWKYAAAILVLIGISSVFLFDAGMTKKQVATRKEQPKQTDKKTEKDPQSDQKATSQPAPSTLTEEIAPGLTSTSNENPSATSPPIVTASSVVTSSGTTINLTATGATTYSWTPSVASTYFTAATSGTYSLTVTDQNATAISGNVNLGFLGYSNTAGIDGGPVNVGKINGLINVVDGVYINEHLATRRLVPYQKLNESGELWTSDEDGSGSHYDAFVENDYRSTAAEPLSTFSIDVDGASYSDVRGMINRGERPNVNSVRIEEFVNYFPYSYAEPAGKDPFSIHTELSECPWNKDHQLLKIGIKGKSIEKTDLPRNNLVFLIDVSGSMEDPEKLELLKKGFRLLVNELREEDRVAICVYAGAAGVVLPPTSGANKDRIMDALNNLRAGGSTAGGEGIKLAYATAEENFQKSGNNRVILATDGDFNVGISNDNALVKLIEEKRESGVFLTVLGFGHDNFQSSKMEKLANNGNGNFSFIDNLLEAKKVLVTEMGATLQTIAKDVKLQLEFNPQHVAAYRLIGYENRLLENEDFNNDTIDAGELGAGHTVTALYELIPAGGNTEESHSENQLKYSTTAYQSNGQFGNELGTVKFRYKAPDGDISQLIEHPIGATSASPSNDFLFVQSVVEFGQLLRRSKYAGSSSYDAVLERAKKAAGEDPYGYRNEFIMLVEKAKLLEIVE